MEKIGKKYSANIYIYHVFTEQCLFAVCWRLHIQVPRAMNAPFFFIFTLLFALLLGRLRKIGIGRFPKEISRKKRPVRKPVAIFLNFAIILTNSRYRKNFKYE